jgi:3-phosphoshikimate 1-carboxyvinyltransferase
LKVNISPPKELRIRATVAITGSKSESNRLLLLKALYPEIQIRNLSNSDDAMVMEQGLQKREGIVDIHHAGTAMRFLTAFFATSEGREVTLTGSHRMKERPISILVDALRQLGADINYLGETGYPPLHIRGKKITAAKVRLPASVSSQYVSALLLVAAGMENGLELELTGKITSLPYIKMTLGLLGRIGIESRVDGQNIRVFPRREAAAGTLVVESDWSSASYFYSIVALAEPGTEIKLTSYRPDSLQGDSVLSTIYEDFGVETSFEGNAIALRKIQKEPKPLLSYDLSDAPDLAQTLAVTCFGMGIGCELTGLHTLKIKETDRLLALETELGKLGASLSVSDDSLTLRTGGDKKKGVAINTYNDHRMAMAFAPLALKTSLTINDAGVVSKSYPDFWKDIKSLGFCLKESV